jgi:hypothetical protein
LYGGVVHCKKCFTREFAKDNQKNMEVLNKAFSK